MSIYSKDIDHIPKGWTKEAVIKSDQKLKNILIKNHISRICDSYLYLYCFEQQGEKANPYAVTEELEHLQGVFEHETADEIFEMAKNNHRNAKEILYTGALYYAFSGDQDKSIKYYEALSDYYKQRGMIKESEKCQEAIKDFQN